MGGAGRAFFIPALKTVYMRDGMFAGGSFSSRLYMRMFLPGTICKVSKISSRQSGTECLYNKNCPALAGNTVKRTGIPLYRDGTKNVPSR